jgi:ADP-ribosylglycohydrolase
MVLPADYIERVYAGVLGKIIGVYLGRPFEGWSYERITQELGDIKYYVHEQLNKPLIVADDDISGTFTFLRALPDYGNRHDLSAAQIGQTWLNYLIENKTVLWWGGMGNSTEHTAYLRLKSGLQAPLSGAAATNGKLVAEQIGAQIFIDGWAMVAPGDPELAADFARRAGSVSHDGEAIYGAQVIAAMEAQAFVEPKLDKLLDTAIRFIPQDSVIYRMIGDLREWRTSISDWREARAMLAKHYGYDTYGGVCHMVPNHGLIILSLLYADDDFDKAMLIVNTSGWDTDCNAGNVGCLMGIQQGLAAFEGKHWREPVADRLYLSSADGGRAISDAVRETYEIVNIGRGLQSMERIKPKDGARFHFSLPGSVQGFTVREGKAHVGNVDGRLRIDAHGTVRVATPTFAPADTRTPGAYYLSVSPTLYSGQTARARVWSNAPSACRLTFQTFDAVDQPIWVDGPAVSLTANEAQILEWTMPPTDGAPITDIGLILESNAAQVTVDWLTWDGPPNVRLKRPAPGSARWRDAWVNAADHFDLYWPEAFRIIQDRGHGIIIQGERAWQDYAVEADVTPRLLRSGGIAARVQNLNRYYALVLVNENRAQLVKWMDTPQVLAETDFSWAYETAYRLRLEVEGERLRASIDGQAVFDVTDTDQPLLDGAVGLVCEVGCLMTDEVRVSPLG